MRQIFKSVKAANGLFLVCLLSLTVSQPARAQFTDSYKFLEAVRKGDSDALLKAIDQPGVTLINTRDRTTGETALHITLARRDLQWTSFLLKHGSRTDIVDNSGRSPLMVAVEKRFPEGVQVLLEIKANPNQANDSGETPLIRAVQVGDLDIVRLLLAGGADPDRRDSIAGMSALDYAKRDNRIPGMIDLLSAKAKVAPSKGIQGPKL